MVELRERVREHVLALAKADPRVVAAAEVGSLALGEGDRWSDLDLTFGVSPEASVADVVEGWTRDLSERFDAVRVLDIDADNRRYRIFLLPGGLQVDLSFAAGHVRRTTPAFRLLFGRERPDLASPPSAPDLLGWGVLYVRAAWVAVSREQPWHAEYCISAVRDHALTLACLRHELPTAYGRGFDRLPRESVGDADSALVRSLERAELVRALAGAVRMLLREAERVPGLDEVERALRELVERAGVAPLR